MTSCSNPHNMGGSKLVCVAARRSRPGKSGTRASDVHRAQPHAHIDAYDGEQVRLLRFSHESLPGWLPNVTATGYSLVGRN